MPAPALEVLACTVRDGANQSRLRRYILKESKSMDVAANNIFFSRNSDSPSRQINIRIHCADIIHIIMKCTILGLQILHVRMGSIFLSPTHSFVQGSWRRKEQLDCAKLSNA
jgi:hypothetical protein